MANTTDTYWSANGVSLQTFAKNIESLAGRFSPPPLRGDDITIPFMPGDRWVPKVAGSRVIPLAMWVRGWDDNGGRSADSQQKFLDNWRYLRNVLWTPGKQIALQKRFYIDGVMRTATAMAEFNGGLEPSMIGSNAAKFVVDLKLADPYFYDDIETTKTLVTGSNTMIVPGDADTRNIMVSFDGSRTNPKIVNTTLNPDVSLEYRGGISSGSSVSVNVAGFSAYTSPNGAANFDSTGLIRHTGSPHWLVLGDGSNTLVLSSDSGSGIVSVQARGAFI